MLLRNILGPSVSKHWYALSGFFVHQRMFIRCHYSGLGPMMQACGHLWSREDFLCSPSFHNARPF